MRIPSPGYIAGKVQTVATLARAGIVRPQRPDRLFHAASALIRWGATPAAGFKAAASRFPDDLAIIDEAGTLTFREVHERTNALAHALAAEGVGPGDRVAIMCRNHRGWVESYVAANKLGAHALFLNTAFSGPQLADVAEREDPVVVIYDDEFAEVLAAASEGRKRFVAWHEPDEARPDRTLEDLIAGTRDTSDLSPPPEQGKALILTSGTTGTPKGASRKQPQSLDPVAALLERIPLKARGRTMIAAPLFHAWGFAHFTLAMGLCTTVVLKRKFDPEGTLSLTAQHECSGARRRADHAPADPRARRRGAPALRPLGAARRCRSRAPRSPPRSPTAGWTCSGRTSTTSTAPRRSPGPRSPRRRTCAPPRAPRAARRAARSCGSTTRRASRSRAGETGRIFVGNDLAFEGYTGGGGKDAIDGLLSSGDVGHLDEDGRLFIDGRDDDMIVSGGENVFPAEVEDLLAGHEAIVEAAVFGVEDEQFGQRLAAVVVVRGERALSEDDVKRFVKSNLAGYKVPRDVRFVDELPRTSTGKVLKRELREG